MNKETINKTYEINGKHYPIMGYCIGEDEKGNSTGFVPLLDIPMMSDYKWHVSCLESRLEHPEWYQDRENVEETIEELKQTIAKYELQSKQ